MCTAHCLRFVSSPEVQIEELPWGQHEWLCRPGLTDAKLLQLVRVTMPPGKSHAFHRHPCMEEFIYYLSGRIEQWVGQSKRIMFPGELAHVPMDEVHGSYNDFDEPAVFLAVLSPAILTGPALVDVSMDEPWRSLRAPIR